MSIEDKVRCLQSLKCPWEVELKSLSNPVEIGIYEDIINSLDTAMDIMCKYQKIEQILKSLDDGEINYPQMTYYLREVLEDGNVN